MTKTPAEIAAGLTDAQRRAMERAKVSEPHSIMPAYYRIEMPCCGMNVNEVSQLRDWGLVSLPITTGPRCGPSIYHGEIHPLGLAVREHLEKK